ncbi:MAG: alkaline phosphatase family protein [Acidobacteriota bacterium]
MKKRTVLIGIDGATFSVLDPLMEEGEMPFLREFVSNGVRAPLQSTVPALTPPAWTSLMTGVSPGKHGIFDFFRKEAPQSHHIRFLTSRDVASGTIWDYVNTHRRRATVLNFPLTFPAPKIDGNLVPGGWMPWRQLRLGCHPSDLFDRLKQNVKTFNPRELAMDMAHEEKALEGCQRQEYEGWIDLHIRREKQWFDVLDYLMAEDPSELTAVLFDGADKLQHLCWSFIDPAYADSVSSQWERGVRQRCLDYYREVDRIVSRIVETAGPECTVIIASDHGFGAQVRTFFVNSWLQRLGYLAWTNGEGPRPSDTQTLGMKQLARHSYLLDWDKTKAYAPLPSGNGIHIVRKDEGHPHGVSESEYEPLRDHLVQELGEVRDPDSGDPVVARVWKREQVFEGPFLELAPDLTLELQDGGLLSILASDDPVQLKASPTGTHRPEGIFIARGEGLKRGEQLSSLSILDVAPTLLHSLGLPIPENMEGRLPEEAFESGWLKGHPVQIGATTAKAGEERPEEKVEQVYTKEDEEELARRLRALGYIE